MNRYLCLLFLFLFSCSWKVTPESVATLYMKNRYFNPSNAYRMIKPGQITKSAFLLKHEEMLRIKDYNLKSIIKFKAIKTETHSNGVIVTVETIRPNLRKVFSSFYQEKISNNWNKKQIRIEIMKRLKDPKCPKETLIDQIQLEQTPTGWRVIVLK